MILTTKDKLLEAEKANPGNTQIMFNLGGVHMLEKDYAKALRYFETVLEVDPEDKDSLFNALVCCKIMGADYNTRELELFRQLLVLDPEYFNLNLTYCEALTNYEYKEEALIALQVLEEKYPTNLDVLCYMSDLLVKSNNVKEGVDYLLKAKNHHGEDPKILIRLGKLQFFAGNIPDSLKAFELASSKVKDNPEVWFYLFNIYKDYGVFKNKDPVCTPDEAFVKYKDLISRGKTF